MLLFPLRGLLCLPATRVSKGKLSILLPYRFPKVFVIISKDDHGVLDMAPRPSWNFTPDSITAQVLAAKRATGFNYSTIQLQQYSITAEFNYIPQHYNQPNRALLNEEWRCRVNRRLAVAGGRESVRDEVAVEETLTARRSLDRRVSESFKEEARVSRICETCDTSKKKISVKYSNEKRETQVVRSDFGYKGFVENIAEEELKMAFEPLNMTVATKKSRCLFSFFMFLGVATQTRTKHGVQWTGPQVSTEEEEERAGK
ncbi:hypothetical protein LXL04_017777 [Taraxacum kok-saghyz]